MSTLWNLISKLFIQIVWYMLNTIINIWCQLKLFYYFYLSMQIMKVIFLLTISTSPPPREKPIRLKIDLSIIILWGKLRTTYWAKVQHMLCIYFCCSELICIVGELLLKEIASSHECVVFFLKMRIVSRIFFYAPSDGGIHFCVWKHCFMHFLKPFS